MVNFKRVVMRFGSVLLLIVMLQVFYFSIVMTMPVKPVRTEAIIVFRGSEPRIQAGYALANQSVAPVIVLSPASEAERRFYDQHYHLPSHVTHLPEPYARTTLANAWYTARLIREHGLKNITLVTANYHMPRSLALLKLFLTGHRVTIQPYKVSPHAYGEMPGNYHTELLKLIYNEILKCWGSVAEYLAWQVFRIFGDEEGRSSKWGLDFLRRVFLLNTRVSW